MMGIYGETCTREELQEAIRHRNMVEKNKEPGHNKPFKEWSIYAKRLPRALAIVRRALEDQSND